MVHLTGSPFQSRDFDFSQFEFQYDKPQKVFDMPVANMANPPVQESILFDCSASTCGLVAPGRGLPQGRQPLEQDIEQNYQQPKNASARIWHHHNSLASHSNGLNPLSINPLPWNMAT